MDNRVYETGVGPSVTTYSQATLVTGISWGAILAGVFVALSVGSILNLLGLGLDLIAIGSHQGAMKNITMLSIIWVVLSSIIAMLAGGWVAGRMSGPQLATEGALHGIVMCGVAIFITFILATSVGSIIGVMSTVVAQSVAMSEHAHAMPEAMQGQNNGMNTPNALNDQSQPNFNANNPSDQAAAQQAKQNAIAHVKDASKHLGILVLIFFGSFLLSAIAAALGGAWGAASDREIFVRKEVRVNRY
jgi:hypothetical protein